jgi:ribosomal protein S27E
VKLFKKTKSEFLLVRLNECARVLTVHYSIQQLLTCSSTSKFV